MIYTSTEKTAIVLNLMGDSFSEIILSKLPREMVERIQQDVIPIMDQVNMPTDIDAFVLEEIVRDTVGAVPVHSTESEALLPETDDIWDPINCDDDELFDQIPLELALNVMLTENKAFQSILLGFFPDTKQSELKNIMIERQINVPLNTEKTPFIIKMESSIKQTFLAKLRAEANQESRRE